MMEGMSRGKCMGCKRKAQSREVICVGDVGDEGVESIGMWGHVKF